jgi:hypothetical protein
VPLALAHVGPRLRVPAEVVAHRAALVALERRGAVDERVVVDAHVRGVEGPHSPAAAHEHVAGDRRPPGDLEEEADLRVLDPVVHEDAVAVAHVVPDAVRVGVVDHQVVADGDAVGLVEDLHRGRVVAGELLDVVPAEDVPLEEHVGGADDVEALGRRVADQRVAQDEPVPAEVAADARAEGDRHVLERRAHDLPAVGPGLLGAYGVVGRLLGDEGRLPLPLDVDRAVGVLRERDAPDRRPLPVGLLAVDRPAHPDEGVVEGGDLDRAGRRIGADVDVAGLVVDVERVPVELALPARRSQEAPVHEDHVVVEAVERRSHALTAPLPPAERLRREERLPRGAPHVAPQGLPLRRNARSLEDRPLVQVRLDRDALVEAQVARAVGAAAHDDRVAAHDLLERGLERRGLGQRRPRRCGPPVGSHVVDVGRARRGTVRLRDRAVGPAGRLGPKRRRGEHEQEQQDAARRREGAGVRGYLVHG